MKIKNCYKMQWLLIIIVTTLLWINKVARWVNTKLYKKFTMPIDYNTVLFSDSFF